MDWTYTVRQEGLDDYGPGFALQYGMARGLELGGSIRYVTRPGRNASRGISSGDIVLHALYQLKPETASWPALAVSAGVEFPTGLDSKGTDLHLAALATHSFEAFRMHGNFLWTRLGATGSTERYDRFEGILGFDWVVHPLRGTDTLLLADVSAELQSGSGRGKSRGHRGRNPAADRTPDDLLRRSRLGADGRAGPRALQGTRRADPCLLTKERIVSCE